MGSQKNDSSPWLVTYKTAPRVLGPVLDSLVHEEYWCTTEWLQKKTKRMTGGLESTVYKERLREQGLFSRKLREDLIAYVQLLGWKTQRRWCTGIPITVHSDKTRGNSHKWKHETFQLDIGAGEGSGITMTVVKYWNRLPWELCSLHCGDVENSTERNPSHPHIIPILGRTLD